MILVSASVVCDGLSLSHSVSPSTSSLSQQVARQAVQSVSQSFSLSLFRYGLLLFWSSVFDCFYYFANNSIAIFSPPAISCLLCNMNNASMSILQRSDGSSQRIVVVFDNWKERNIYNTRNSFCEVWSPFGRSAQSSQGPGHERHITHFVR